MNVILILPPSAAIPALGAGIAGAVIAGVRTPFNVFVDMQAELISLKMHRHLVEHQIPGREGGILQDLGSASSVITLRGKWIYENRPVGDILDTIPALAIFENKSIGWNWLRLQMMMLIYRLREPMILASDLISTVVLIEDFDPTYEGGRPNVYNYTMTLREVDPRLTLAGMLVTPLAKTILPIPQEGMGL